MIITNSSLELQVSLHINHQNNEKVWSLGFIRGMVVKCTVMSWTFSWPQELGHQWSFQLISVQVRCLQSLVKTCRCEKNFLFLHSVLKSVAAMVESFLLANGFLGLCVWLHTWTGSHCWQTKSTRWCSPGENVSVIGFCSVDHVSWFCVTGQDNDSPNLI